MANNPSPNQLKPMIIAVILSQPTPYLVYLAKRSSKSASMDYL
jgi:hypothetical protein